MKQDPRFVPASRDYTLGVKQNPYEAGLPTMKWSERLKTDLALAKSPYLVKTTGQAVQVAFSPFWTVPDLVRPQFIRDADHVLVRPVETFVVAVQGMMALTNATAQQALRRIPLYQQILDVIRHWDLDTMSRELSILQREPRGRSFADLIPLTQAILRPVVRLSKLNPHVHMVPALAKAFELARFHLVKRDERDLLQQYYSIAREELPELFARLRLRLYPVLLKVLADKYFDLDPFYLEKEAEVMTFLRLKESDLILDVPENAPQAVPIRVTLPPQRSADAPVVPRMAQLGLEWLDRMFPKAGWNNLSENPDFYSYFQTIFDYPKGSDLIPVDDPVQVIQPLSEIIQQLFYGFQTIQWGTLLNLSGETIRIQEELEKCLSRWHFFHEEFFGKNYFPLLHEYCREVERSGPLAPDSKRREHQLSWLKRNYLMPQMTLPIVEDVRVKSLGYPNLSVQVKEMIDLLAPIAIEIEQRGTKANSVLNPEFRARFPVSTMVGTRFQHALRRTDEGTGGERRILDQGNNKSLILCTLSLLSTLDFLISKHGSPLYSRKPAFLYRTSSSSGDDKPVYNAPRRNSLMLLKRLNEQPPPLLSEVPWPSRSSEMFGPLLAAEEIKRRIHEHQVEKKAFSVINFRVWPEEQRREFAALITLMLEDGTRIHPQDDGSWTYVMKETNVDQAEDFARKVLGAAARRTPPLAVGALVVSHFAGATAEKILSLPPRGWALARNIPAQVLGLWDNLKQTFEFKTDVPNVSPTPPPPTEAEALDPPEEQQDEIVPEPDDESEDDEGDEVDEDEEDAEESAIPRG